MAIIVVHIEDRSLPATIFILETTERERETITLAHLRGLNTLSRSVPVGKGLSDSHPRHANDCNAPSRCSFVFLLFLFFSGDR